MPGMQGVGQKSAVLRLNLYDLAARPHLMSIDAEGVHDKQTDARSGQIRNERHTPTNRLTGALVLFQGYPSALTTRGSKKIKNGVPLADNSAIAVRLTPLTSAPSPSKMHLRGLRPACNRINPVLYTNAPDSFTHRSEMRMIFAP